MEKAIRRMQNFFRREDGPTAVEYAVMVGLIAVVCLAGVRRIGNKSKTTFKNVSKSVGS
jgi:pilus assembly protein Flp/PilA